MLRPSHGTAGFTLLEMLLASTILVVLSGLVLTITTYVTGAWKSASAQFTSENRAQLVFDTLSHDLESACIGRGHGTWLQMEIEDAAEAGAGAAEDSLHLMFFTRNPDEKEGEAPAAGPSAVSYRLASRRISSAGFLVHGLFRAVMDPENTFHHAMDARYQANLKQGIWDSGEAAPWNDLSGDGRNLSPAEWSLDEANLLAVNVADFKATLYYRDPRGHVNAVFVSPAEGAGKSLTLGERIIVDGDPRDYEKVLYLEVSLGFLSGEGANYGRSHFQREVSPREIQPGPGEIFIQRIAFSSGSL